VDSPHETSHGFRQDAWTSWKGNILLFLLVSNTGLDGIGSVNAKAINHIAQCYRIERTVSFALIHCADNLHQAKFQHRFCWGAFI